MPTVQQLIAKHQRELDNLNVTFLAKRKVYDKHRQDGAKMEVELNKLGVQIEKKEEVIKNYRNDFNVPEPKPKAPIKRVRKPKKK